MPVPEAVNESLKVELLPGAMLNGSEGAELIENPVPETERAVIGTAEMVVLGLLMLKVNEFDPVPPAMLWPRLIGVAGCAVSLTPVEST